MTNEFVTAFLLRHILRPVVFTSSIPIGNSTTLENTTGEKVEISREPGMTRIIYDQFHHSDITSDNDPHDFFIQLNQYPL